MSSRGRTATIWQKTLVPGMRRCGKKEGEYRKQLRDVKETHLVVQVLDTDRILRQLVLLLDRRSSKRTLEFPALRLPLILDDLSVASALLQTERRVSKKVEER